MRTSRERRGECIKRLQREVDLYTRATDAIARFVHVRAAYMRRDLAAQLCEHVERLAYEEDRRARWRRSMMASLA